MQWTSITPTIIFGDNLMQHYNSTKIFSSDKETQVQVSSHRCSYAVWIDDEHVTITGPGVSERALRDELPTIDDAEDLAIACIILFENGNF